MTALARIETVLFLREVELFQFCEAEEILRLAGIARERRFERAETLYRRGDPPEALYCVLEGAVRLDDGAAPARTVGPKGTFGVLDILSGRLRSGEATAEAGTAVFGIEAEDFFDLLSNNIDIVKALFRRLTRTPAEPGREGDLS